MRLKRKIGRPQAKLASTTITEKQKGVELSTFYPRLKKVKFESPPLRIYKSGENFLSLEKYKIESTGNKKDKKMNVEPSNDDKAFNDIEKVMKILKEPKNNSSSNDCEDKTQNRTARSFGSMDNYANVRKGLIEQKTRRPSETDNVSKIKTLDILIEQKNEILEIRKQKRKNRDSNLTIDSYANTVPKDFNSKSVQTDFSQALGGTPNKKTKIRSSSKLILEEKSKIALLIEEKEALNAMNLQLIEELKAQREQIFKSALAEKEELKRTYTHKMCLLENIINERAISNEKKKINIQSLHDRLIINENERIAMNEQLQEIKGNLRVFCRLKPIADNSKSVFEVPNQGTKARMLHLLQANSKPKRFLFDRIFDDSNTQEDVYKEIKPFVQSAFDGNSVTIFAYGQTGSGKTYTLEGDDRYPGILSRSLELLLKLKEDDEKVGRSVQLTISCLEIYNERLIDLLNDEVDLNSDLRIQITNGSVNILNLKEVSLKYTHQINELCDKAAQNRNVEATSHNERSSRSHCVYRIKIFQNATSSEKCATGTLNIIDLAGNERSSLAIDEKLSTDKAKKIQKEATFINRSLTTLGRIMRLLKEQKMTGIQTNLPVRETKLTRILQDCLGDTCQTLLFINVCQEEANLCQTKESLNFASFTVN
jgi:kinesin family protein C1